MTKKNRMNKLDEMQNQKLLKLEEYGFWIMFWALAVAIAVQLLTGATIKEVAGKSIVLLIGSIYLSITALKNGIWTRKATPTRKGNAMASLIAAIVIGALNGVKLVKTGKTDAGSLLTAIAISAATFLACFVVLELFRATYNKRRSELDDIDEESEV